MKFLVPNYSCLQNPWLRGYRPQIPFLSVLNWICWTPPLKKIPGYATVYHHTSTIISCCRHLLVRWVWMVQILQEFLTGRTTLHGQMHSPLTILPIVSTLLMLTWIILHLPTSKATIATSSYQVRRCRTCLPLLCLMTSFTGLIGIWRLSAKPISLQVRHISCILWQVKIRINASSSDVRLATELWNMFGYRFYYCPCQKDINKFLLCLYLGVAAFISLIKRTHFWNFVILLQKGQRIDVFLDVKQCHLLKCFSVFQRIMMLPSSRVNSKIVTDILRDHNAFRSSVNYQPVTTE